jgi:3-hydroxybutyryl-CoA dehydrogenase
VLATNTSSILVASLAGAAAHPENVVGMHFFNPAPLMPLLEVVAAADSGERAVEVARATGEAMGKRVIVANDGPGFIVNRCGRPFYTEALRLLQERVASVEQIDRICRMGGGFPMGPFELMDLVGIDVGLEVARSFQEQSFGEPRWRPNPIQARMVAAGRHGRKTGRGYYEYGTEPYRPEDPEPPAVGGGGGREIAFWGAGTLARELREAATAAGYVALVPSPELESRTRAASGPAIVEVRPELVVDASVPSPEGEVLVTLGGAATPRLVSCVDRSLAAMGDPAACGFHVLPPLADARIVELTRHPGTPAETAAAAEAFFASLGFVTEWVGDAPGLLLGRIVCQLVNEAAFALGEGVGSAEDIDAGLELGLRHPRGPVAWGSAIGLEHVLATIDGLFSERHEERYRAAPLLRRAVALGEASLAA